MVSDKHLYIIRDIKADLFERRRSKHSLNHAQKKTANFATSICMFIRDMKSDLFERRRQLQVHSTSGIIMLVHKEIGLEIGGLGDAFAATE